MTELLSVEHLEVTFPCGVRAVDDVSLTVGAHEIVGIVGESGSGKSALAKAIAGLLPSKTQVLGKRTFQGKRIGVVFQDPMSALNPTMTIGKQIAEVCSKREALQWLVKMGLQDPEILYNSYPHQLSGGMRQRVLIAIALAQEPELLIADEPTTALDSTTAVGILDLLLSLQREQGLSLLFISHDLNLVSRFAKRVYVMRQGKIVESGEVHELFSAPKHPYTQLLLASIPRQPAPSLPRLPQEGPLLSIRNLSKSYGSKRALSSFSLDLYPGETVGLVGESGSGKTTAAKLLLRLLATTSGEADFLGRNLLTLAGKELRSYRKEIQMVFQDPQSCLDPRRTVREILEEPLRIHCLPLSRRETLLASVGLSALYLGRYPHELSGGERQRVGIARALASCPKLIICDEPTSSLDVSIQSQILKLLRELQQAEGLTYLYISHDLPTVRTMANRIAVLYRGHLVELAETEELFENPLHPYTQSLLAASRGEKLEWDKRAPLMELSEVTPSHFAAV